ncbi:unnamed protein product [marine sediment metagenome]|uniref:Uncharacterized protein n=1 Tax=marine sediment metagenome TaxID=412755 RepID=X0TAC9_9ZZZZ
MPDSVRQQIINAFKTRLGTVLIAGGYETDLGSNVFEWKTAEWQESEMPGVDVRDPSEAGVIRGGDHEFALSIELEVKVTGTTSPSQVRDIIGDIITAIGTDPGFGGLVQGFEPVQNPSMGFDQKDKTFGSILLNFDLRYLTKAFTPFETA